MGSSPSIARNNGARQRRGFLGGLTSLAMLAAMLPLSGLGVLLGTLDAAAAPSTIPIGNVEVRQDRFSASETAAVYPAEDCLQIAPVTGAANSTDWVGAGSTVRAATAHGSSGDDCPTAVDTAVQSVISAQPYNPGTVTEGVPFLLADYYHNNNPVNNVTDVSYSKLSVRFLNSTIGLPFSLWETPNAADPCPVATPAGEDCWDELVFDTNIGDQTVTVDGATYRLVVNGFVPVNDTTTACPTTPVAGSFENSFITAEAVTTKGCLYARMDRVRNLTITKEVTAGSPGAAFTFGSTSDIPGSPWQSSFELTPSAGGTDSITQEILSTEDVTITEQVPDKWTNTNLECEANGATVPVTATGGADVSGRPAVRVWNLIDLDDVADVNCTFTNDYQPAGTLTLVKSVNGGAADASDWTLSASGPTPISGVGGSPAVTSQTVNAGTYMLAESGATAAASGYLQDGAWTCSGGLVTTADGVSSVRVADDASVTCTVENRFVTGAVSVSKVITDPDNGFAGSAATNFTGSLSCVGPNGDYTWTASTGTAWTSPQIPAGSTCSVTSETAPPASLLADTSYEWVSPPDLGSSATVGDGSTQNITVTNAIRRNTGELTLSKVVEPAAGTQAAYQGATTRTFPISYSCDIGGTEVASGNAPLGAGQSTTVQVPATSTCTITEAKPTVEAGDFPDTSYSWQTPTITAPVLIEQGTTSIGTVTNTYTRNYGSINISKVVTGPGAASVPAGTTFDVTYTCGTGFSGSVAVAPGTPVTVENLPLGASCTLAEPTQPDVLPDAYAWGPATVSGPVVVDTPVNTGTVTNPTVAQYGQLRITKTLDDAGAVAGTTFAITVACDAPAEGGTENYTDTFSLPAGGSASTPNLLLGTSCSVSESDPSTEALVNDSYAWGITPATQTVAVAGPQGTVTNVSVVNTIERVYGGLNIVKAITDPDGVVASQTFAGDWTCSLGDDTASGTWTSTGAGPATLDGDTATILRGSTCDVTETLTGVPNQEQPLYVWGPVSYSPDGGQVDVGAVSPTVTVTNTVVQQDSGFRVSKSVTGALAGLSPNSAFDLSATCTNPDDSSADARTFAWSLGNGGTGMAALPIGWRCTVTEAANPATTNPDRYTYQAPVFTLDPSAGTSASTDGRAVSFTVTQVPAAQTLSLSVENPLVENRTTIVVDKVISGLTAAAPEGDYAVIVDCGVDGSQGGVFSPGSAATFDVAVGSSCSVTEVGKPVLGADFQWGTATYSVNGGDSSASAPVVTTVAAATTVTVTNPILAVLVSVELTKSVVDVYGVVPDDQNFSGTFTCTPPLGGDAVTGDWSATAGETIVLSDAVPSGSDCTATEMDPSGPAANHFWADPVITGVTTTPSGGTISVVNEVIRRNGDVTVLKTLDVPAGGYVGEGAAFTVNYLCVDGDDRYEGTLDIVPGADAVTLASDIPFGVECNVSEVTPSADLLRDSSFAWNDPVVSPDTFTLTDDTPTVEVSVANSARRVYGLYDVDKIVAGVPDSVSVTGQYGGAWECVLGEESSAGTWSAEADGTGEVLSVDGEAFDGEVLVGSSCSITETTAATFSDPSWDWRAPVFGDPVTVVAGEVAAVSTVTNEAVRSFADFTITKVFEGPAYALADNAEVNGSWTCASQSTPAEVISGRWVLPAAGGTVTINEGVGAMRIPSGSACSVMEDTPAADALFDDSWTWTTPVIAPASATTVTTEESGEFTVTNDVTRVTGAVQITKEVVGGNSGEQVFEGDWSCSYTGREDTDEDDVVSTGQWSHTPGADPYVIVAPVGSVCMVDNEEQPGVPVPGDPSWVWTDLDISAPVTVSADSPGGITVTNTMTRLFGGLNVIKAITGNAPGNVGDIEFAFDWECVAGDDGPLTGSFTLTSGETFSAGEGTLPSGSVCSLTESPVDEDDPSYTWGAPAFTGADENTGWTVSDDGRTVSGITIGDAETPVVVRVTNPVVKNSYTLTKTADPVTGSRVEPGDEITYTVTVTPSDGTVTGLIVTDDMEDVLTHATLNEGSIAATSGTAALAGNDLTWIVGDIGASVPVTLSYTVTVNADAWNVVLRNAVTSTADVPEEECETCVTTTEHPTPGYVVSKTADPATGSAVVPGQVITYSVKATNTSTAVVDDSGLTDDLSGVLEHATWVGFVDEPEGATLEGTTLTWDAGVLEVGETRTLSYQVKVNDDTSGTRLNNRIEPKVDTGGECPIPGDATSRVTEDDPEVCETEHFVPGWTLTKTSDPVSGSKVLPDQTITYTLTVNNVGQKPLVGAVVNDDISDVLAHATWLDEVTGEGLEIDGNALTWSVPEVDIDGSASVSYSVKVNKNAAGVTLRNVATTKTPGGGCVTNCVTEHDVPGWSATKTSDPASGSLVRRGDLITYTVKVTALDKGDIEDVVITDDLAEVLRNADMVGAARVTAGSVAMTGGKLVWTLDVLPSGSVQTMVYSVRVKATKASEFRNAVVVTGELPPSSCDPCSTVHKTPDGPPVKPNPTMPNTGAPVGLLPAILGGLVLLGGGAYLIRRRTLS